MSVPTPETLSRTFGFVRKLMAEVEPHLLDVYDLALDRPHSGDANTRTRGGSIGDLHDSGDVEAERVLSNALGALRFAESALRAIQWYMDPDEKDGDDRVTRRDSRADVSALEFGVALRTRDKRTVTGERQSARLGSQPLRKPHRDPYIELTTLQAAVRRGVPAFVEAHSDCRDENGRRKPRSIDRSVMSPAQRDAFDRALTKDQEAEAS